MKAVADTPDAYYIVARDRPDPETRALKDGETFAVFDVFGDISGRRRRRRGCITTAPATSRAASCG